MLDHVGAHHDGTSDQVVGEHQRFVALQVMLDPASIRVIGTGALDVCAKVDPHDLKLGCEGRDLVPNTAADVNDSAGALLASDVNDSSVNVCLPNNLAAAVMETIVRLLADPIAFLDEV